MSLGFLLSLWAGSSAISTFVDSIVEAHGQQEHRHPVWQRVFALLLYVMFLILAVFTLPLVALGPNLIGRALPESWYDLGSRIVDTFYYPAVGLLLLVGGLTTLYKVALPKSLPWHRLLGGAVVAGAFFLAASEGLRWYLSWLAGTGYTYGALATPPIAFLLFTFFLASRWCSAPSSTRPCRNSGRRGPPDSSSGANGWPSRPRSSRHRNWGR